MNPTDLCFAPAEFLRLIEDDGLTGTWAWAFASGQQTWSPGLFRLLGLDPMQTQASYGLLTDLVHPEDRLHLASASDLLRGQALPKREVRVVRSDGTLRTITMRTELHLTPDGRPRAAAGIVLDVTDAAALLRMRQTDQRRRSALLAASRILFIPVDLDGTYHFPPEAVQFVGRPMEDIVADPYADVVTAERAAFIDRIAQRQPEQVFQAGALHQHRNREPEHYRVLSVPVHDEHGRLIERSGIFYPAALGTPPLAAGLVRPGLEQAVEGRHLRAARALLDWSMTTLAEASGLSLSTVRRLEENAEGQGSRSRHKAIAALRHAGIRFILLENNEISIARW